MVKRRSRKWEDEVSGGDDVSNKVYQCRYKKKESKEMLTKYNNEGHFNAPNLGSWNDSSR